MEFPLAFRAEVNAWKERAVRAEEQYDRIFALFEARMPIDGAPRVYSSTPVAPLAALRADVETVRPDADGFLPSYDLPPEVEEAIKMRAPRGTPLFEELTDDARQAIELMGGDFDPDAYAEVIRRGTRVTGWPM